MPEQIDLSIIVVPYKNPEKVRVTLNSIYKSKTDFAYEVICVDSGSGDNTPDMIAGEFPQTILIRNSNEGFAKSNNRGMWQARGRYILLLNPDTELMPDALQATFDAMQQRKDVGALSCKLVKGDGKLDLACRRSFPNFWGALSRFLHLSLFFPRSKFFSKYNLTYLPEDQEAYVDAISGAFFLTRREVIDQVGMFDEAFFMYNEDFDWCYRIKQAGWKILYYPKVVCIHYKGSSSRKAPYRSLRAFADSIWIWYKKHYAPKYPFFVNWLVFAGIWVRFGVLVIINYFRKNPYVSR